VPPTFDPVIATGMAKDPDLRYATTVELANAAHDAITTPLAPANKATRLSELTRPAPEVWRQPELNLAAPQQHPPGGWSIPQARLVDGPLR
jgi:hypothetical protein